MQTNANGESKTVTLFLCGDVMTGRGIDQILPNPCDPILYEGYTEDAREYVRLAEHASGWIPQPAAFSYIWGDALDEWARWAPDTRLVNLETSITTSGRAWPKGINYRMHPRNVPCLTEAHFDGCALANNHVLDWGYDGLSETIRTLRAAGIQTAGAGRNLEEAAAPAIFDISKKGRVLLFSLGSATSGIPRAWAAGEDEPGIFLFDESSPEAVRRVTDRIRRAKREGDIAVASLHWGPNWGYAVPSDQRAFAHGLIDGAGIDVIHGHSSHHPKGIEVYAGRPILYGSGDFLNDYEGIGGYEEYRDDLTLMYFITIDAATGRLLLLSMVPLCIKSFRLNRAARADALWLGRTLGRECESLGTAVELEDATTLRLVWH